MVEAVILGSGTSNGVPTLGVEYSAEFLAKPKNHRTRSSLLLRGPEGNLLVDCSPEMRLQLLREDVSQVDAVIITHTHADHIMGMDDLRAFVLKTGRDMPVYAYPEHQVDIRRVFAYAFAELPPGIEVPRFELMDLPPVLKTCGMEVQSFRVRHGATEVAALKVNRFGYITDVSEIPAEVWPHFCDLDTLVIDAVRRRPHPNHLHFARAIEVAEQLGAKMTYFTHLSHDYDHDITERDELPPTIRLAFDGLRIDIL
ncbi:MAG: MBL fold metallo-hydrolase [Chthonomonas sp.]|nr:MBL fold metallo-hydrolase [Chthonomonas sp.]